jgi:hypothetical protein
MLAELALTLTLHTQRLIRFTALSISGILAMIMILAMLMVNVEELIIALMTLATAGGAGEQYLLLRIVQIHGQD